MTTWGGKRLFFRNIKKERLGKCGTYAWWWRFYESIVIWKSIKSYTKIHTPSKGLRRRRKKGESQLHSGDKVSVYTKIVFIVRGRSVGRVRIDSSRAHTQPLTGHRMKSFTIYCLLTIAIWQWESPAMYIWWAWSVIAMVCRKLTAVWIHGIHSLLFNLSTTCAGRERSTMWMWMVLWWEKWLNASLKLHTRAGSISHIKSNTDNSHCCRAESRWWVWRKSKRFVWLFLWAFSVCFVCTPERFFAYWNINFIHSMFRKNISCYRSHQK